MHVQLPRTLDEKLVDIEQSYRWLKSGDIKGETESTIVAAEGQAISTNYFKNKVVSCKVETESKYRLCKEHHHNHRHHHHHKRQGLGPLIRSVSRVTAARANAFSVFQLFSFLVICSGMISKGFGFVASLQV